MCGIIGYIGIKKSVPILLKGLERLEYRGYDSAGIAIINDGRITRVRSVGRVGALSEKITEIGEFSSTIGIAHTRWATHGGVTEANAHPHVSFDGRLAVVHNGIIENYRELKMRWPDRVFASETDSEMIAHLIMDTLSTGVSFRESVEEAVRHLRGTYAIAVIHADYPDELIVARKGSPIVIGIADDGYYIASDATPILPHTRQVVFLDDDEIACIQKDGYTIVHPEFGSRNKVCESIDWTDEEAMLGGFPDYMMKEIHDQPRVIQDAIRGRMNISGGTAHLGGISLSEDEMRTIDHIILVGCGTALHAAEVGAYYFEQFARIPAIAVVASEFRYSDPMLSPHTLVFVLSQSGETADTLGALREAKQKGAIVRAIVNVVGSTIAREAGAGTYIHAGPELSVASTKAYSNMVSVLLLYAVQFGRLRSVSYEDGKRVLLDLMNLPEKMHRVLAMSQSIRTIAERLAAYDHLFFLGRGVHAIAAKEGSLKMKEISYIHSEAYPAGEMKHGPIALLSEQFPVLAIATGGLFFDKMRSTIEEVSARRAPTVIITTEDPHLFGDTAQGIIRIPETHPLIEPLLVGLVCQLLSYHVAVSLGRNVDRPRNLAKSVTVE